MNLESNLELESVEADIKAWFDEYPEGRYIPTLPILIQISRSLRSILEKGAHGENGADKGEYPQDDIKPENAAGEDRGCLLVSLDRIGQLLDEDGGECSLDLLVKLRARLGVVTQRLDDLIGRHADVRTDVSSHKKDVVLADDRVAGKAGEDGQ